MGKWEEWREGTRSFKREPYLQSHGGGEKFGKFEKKKKKKHDWSVKSKGVRGPKGRGRGIRLCLNHLLFTDRDTLHRECKK